VLKKIKYEETGKLISFLMEKGELFAPVEEKAGANFRRISDPDEVTLDSYNTVQSPKCVFFPQTDDMVKYNLKKEGTETEEVSPDSSTRIVFGVRPCDVKSFEIMDRLFAEDIIDPYWENRRKNTLIIGYAFDRVDASDFYDTFGVHASDTTGSDIFMIRTEEYILLKGITEKGIGLLDPAKILEEASAEDEKYFTEKTGKDPKLKTRTIDIEGSAEKLEGIFENPYWEKAAAPCLNCGICTFVCPTCHCFDIQDETMFGKGTRKKIWDSCMFTDFTLHASGHNPRTEKFQRLRQRVNHKFSYYVTNFDTISCVGCGRCTRSCPVNIDIAKVVHEALSL
jgi:ferredoxin